MMIRSHLLLGMEGGWKEHFEFWNCVIIIQAAGLPDLGYSERERECSQVRGQLHETPVVFRMVPRPRDTAMVSEVRITKWFIYEKVWCVMYIYWLEYLWPLGDVVEILMHKKTRKRKDHRWFHKRRERNCPQPQTDKISQRGEQPAQGHSPTVGRIRCSPFWNAKSCLLSFQLSLLFP